ncbi:MAG: transposase [Bacteriovorax sp.]|jgi:REP element-mobilizing transposase RayT
MKKKTLYNIKGAGRPAIHDRGIRHVARDEIKRRTPLHLTIKINKEKSGLRNKSIIKALHSSIKKARLIGLRVIHYTLEYDHVHLLIETESNVLLGKGMQSFGISFSKGINKIKGLKGQVFKTRYHFRKLKTPAEIKNAINYILGNSVKHKQASSIITPYNSLPAIADFSRLYPGFERMIEDTIDSSSFLSALKIELKNVLYEPGHFLIRKWIG